MSLENVKVEIISVEPVGEQIVDVTFGLNPVPTDAWLGSLKGTIAVRRTRLERESEWEFRRVGGNGQIVFRWPQRTALAKVDVLVERVDEANSRFKELMAKMAQEENRTAVVTPEEKKAADALKEEILKKLQ